VIDLTEAAEGQTASAKRTPFALQDDLLRRTPSILISYRQAALLVPYLSVM